MSQRYATENQNFTGEAIANLRSDLGRAVLGRRLSRAEMARLCGLNRPETDGADTVSKWERGARDVTGPVTALLGTFAQIFDDTASQAFVDAMVATIRKRLRPEEIQS